MTISKPEALLFLGLPEDAGPELIQARFGEKYSFFTTLYNNAPNPAIKALQQKNIHTLESIKRLFSLKDLDKRREDESKQYAFKTSEKNKNSEPMAWLVVHTEQKQQQSFPLFAGDNCIGRVAIPDKHNILITDDHHISRFHCLLQIALQAVCTLFDDGRFNKGKKSGNGTYINGNDQSVDRMMLADGDTIQVGSTKLVFRWNKGHIDDIEEEVNHTDYVKTIVIGL